MPRRKMRKPSQIARDRAAVSRMILESYSYVEIAQTLGLTDHQVSNDAMAIRKAWRREAREDIDRHKEKEFERLKHLENVNWIEFEKSKIRVFKDKETGKPIPVEVPGDARFLQNIESCIYKRMRLLGLEAPQRVDVKGSIEQKTELTITVKKVEIDERVETLEKELKRLGFSRDASGVHKCLKG